MTDNSHRTRTFIIGSCVSRDLMAFLPPNTYEVVGYVARQSLITAQRPPLDYHVDTSSMSSRFQRRITSGSLSGNLYTALSEVDYVDAVLWDLTDERSGVFEFANQTYLTRTVELDAARLTQSIARDALRHLPFGSDEHFALWQIGAIQLTEALRRRHLLERTFIVAPPWASQDSDGKPTSPSYGYSADLANAHYERYIRYAEELLERSRLTATDPRTDPEHRWGPAPFHYTSSTYEQLASQLEVHFHSRTSTPQAPAGSKTEQPSGRQFYTYEDLTVASEFRFVGAGQPTVVVVETLQRSDIEAGTPWARDTLDIQAWANVVYINDPTLLVEDPLVIGWGLGSSSHLGLNALLNHVQSLDGPSGAHRIYVGSGAGGHIALQLAILDSADAAIISNPDLGWSERQTPSTRDAIARICAGRQLAAAEIDVRRHERRSARPAVSAFVNTAHPEQWNSQLRILADLQTADSPIDAQRSEVHTYHDPERPYVPVDQAKLVEAIMGRASRNGAPN